MPRTARSWEPQGIFHVDARAHDGDPIFESDDDREFVMARAARVFREEGVTCYGLAVLDNHYHAIGRFEGPPGRAILRLNTAIARRVRKGGGDGAVFEGRFFSALCTDESALLLRLAYVTANPVHHKVVPTVGALLGWRWSTLGETLGLRAPRVTNVRETLAIFDESRADRARAALVDWLETRARAWRERDDAPDADPDLAPRPGATPVPRRLADDLGVPRTLGVVDGPLPAPALSSTWEQRWARRAELRDAGWSPEHLARLACGLCRADPDDLRAGRRDRVTSRARAIVATVACGHLGWPTAEVARVVGTSSSAVMQAVARGATELDGLGVDAEAVVVRSAAEVGSLRS